MRGVRHLDHEGIGDRVRQQRLYVIAGMDGEMMPSFGFEGHLPAQGRAAVVADDGDAGLAAKAGNRFGEPEFAGCDGGEIGIFLGEAGAHERTDTGLQQAVADRVVDHILDPRGERGDAAFLVVFRSDGDDRDARGKIGLADDAPHIHRVAIGQAHRGEDQIGPAAA